MTLSFPAPFCFRGGTAHLVRLGAVCGLALLGLFPFAPAHADGPVGADAKDLPYAIEEEILDAAIDHCMRGEADPARALIQAMREQLNPPESILQLIRQLEASGCRSALPASPNRWMLQAGVGFDDNVSQGISIRTLTLGSGLNSMELALGDGYRPRPSTYALLNVDRQFVLGERAVGQVSVQHRHNHQVPGLNLTSLAASAAHPFAMLERAGRLQAEFSQTWLGGSRYQQAMAAGLQWLLPGEPQPWILNVTSTRAHYPSQPDQDALQTEAGLWRERQLHSALAVFGGISLYHDHALGRRPGRHRSGMHYQLGATVAMDEWQFRPQISVLRWRSSEVFSSGLIDVVREHQMTQLALQMTRNYAPGRQLVLEWRARGAHDAVPLFTYQGRSLAVYWRQQY